MNELQGMILEIDFSFTSPMVDYSEPMDFINEVKFNILLVDNEDNRELIGKGVFNLILLERALSLNRDLYEVMDASHSISEITDLLDLDNVFGIFDKIEVFYPEEDPILNANIALLERIEILPKYRGLGISAMVMKRIIEQFYGWFDLVVLKAFPLQYDGNNANIDDWHALMSYSELKGDFEKSQKKLFELYHGMGFENPFGNEFFISRSEKILFHKNENPLIFDE